MRPAFLIRQRPGHLERGFTLIELMIALAIFAVVMAFAIPSYSEHVRRSARMDAQMMLLRAANELEWIYTQCNNYTHLYDAEDTSDTPCKENKTVIESFVRDKVLPASQVNLQRYRLDIALQEQAFTLKAIRKRPGPQSKDKCGTFILDNLGNRSLEHNDPQFELKECWNR